MNLASESSLSLRRMLGLKLPYRPALMKIFGTGPNSKLYHV